jgi:ABC-type nitrate/sulfonate/bicarbonate transport system substrate-binding protein
MLRRDFLCRAAAAGLAGGFAPARRVFGQSAGLHQINIVSTAGTTNRVIAELIRQMGYFSEMGVEPEHITVGDGTKVVAALISGDADICPTSGFTQVLAAAEKGAPLKIIAGGATKNFNALFSGNPAIRKLHDLEGHTVGIGALGSQLYQVMIALFNKYGVDSSKVRFANVGSSVDVFRAVMARVVDAGCAEVWLQRDSGLHIVEQGKTFESLPEFVNQAAFTSERAIRDKREALVRTLAAYAKVYRFIMSGESREAFLAASATALGQNSLDLAQAQWQFYRDSQPFAADLVLAEERIAYMQELNIKTEMQKKLVPYGQVTDMSVARDALALLS